MAIARLDSLGVLDATFSPGGTEGSGKAIVGFNAGGNEFDGLEGMAVQPDGKIVVAGTVQVGGAGDYDFGVVRFTAAGGLDGTFDGDGKATFGLNVGGSNADKVAGMALDVDGRIVVAGTVQRQDAGDTDFGATRFLADEPKAPVVLLPGGPEIIDQTTRGILGTATAGSLVRVFRDVNNNNQIDAGVDTVVGQQQLGPGATLYIVIVPLIEAAANNFLVMASSVNGQSPVTDVPTIQDEGIVARVRKRPSGKYIVQVRGALTGVLKKVFGPYTGPVRTRRLDVDFDGTPDLIIRYYQNGKARRKAYNGRTLAPLPIK
jgi:uncharacterized delta-60 repeat protein